MQFVVSRTVWFTALFTPAYQHLVMIFIKSIVIIFTSFVFDDYINLLIIISTKYLMVSTLQFESDST